MAITPIFILGSPRNGTTWLSNIVGDYQSVSSVRHFLHWGNHESNIYKKVKYYGDITQLNNYIHFVELFSISDLFKLANGNKEKLKNAQYSSFYDAYFDLMNDLAESENNKFWITKLDPQFFKDPDEFQRFKKHLMKRYPDVKFLFIKRELKSVIHSYINFVSHKKELKKTKILLIALKQIAIKITYEDFFLEIISEFNGIRFRYEELLNDYDHHINRLENYIGIKEFKLRDRNYLKNSSFYRKKIVKLSESTLWILTKVIYPIMQLLKPLTKKAVRMQKKNQAGKPAFYRMIKHQYYKEKWIEETKKNNLDRILHLIDQYDKKEKIN
jgi:hypothetical protein